MSKVAFLWDESFLWGLMAYKTLKGLGLPFDLIRSRDIKKGCLKNYRMLFVPGGWASNKLKALGDKGAEEIKRFVHDGGSYFGICGGAGLATVDGLGLLNIKRKPTKQRVPSFSGRIYLDINEHQIWKGIDKRLHEFTNSPIHPFTDSPIHPFTNSPIFYAWWPSQFVVNDSDIETLATFQDAMPDSFSSDLNVGDVRANGGWEEFEKLYGINLDPERLRDEPAVVEGRFGNGKVLLSLIHFDTSGDENGAIVLRNIWQYLGDETAMEGTSARQIVRLKADSFTPSPIDQLTNSPIDPFTPSPLHQFTNSPIKNSCSAALLRYCSEIIDFGIRNFLWFWRTPMLLQWRRGVRGLEYNTLYIMAKEIVELENQAKGVTDQQIVSLKNSFSLQPLALFKEKALCLLMLERQAMLKGVINYEYSDDPEIQALRKELFGNSKSYGGKFKEFLDQIDYLLYQKLIRED